jgi:hypothetical protein
MDRIRAMSRAPVRRCFEARFTAARKDYVAAYERLLSGTVRRETGSSVAAWGRRWCLGSAQSTTDPDRYRKGGGSSDPAFA